MTRLRFVAWHCSERSCSLVRRSAILSSPVPQVDTHSDALLQRRLRDLRGVTLLTIAHRINTIIDSDRILVLG